MKQFGFPKKYRLRSSREFARVYDLRERAGDRHLLVFGARNDLGWTRAGLSVSRKHGNAVRRARLKRLLREAFRLTRPRLDSGLDLILIPRQNSGAGVEDYMSSLRRLVSQLNTRLPVLEDRSDGEG